MVQGQRDGQGEDFACSFPGLFQSVQRVPVLAGFHIEEDQGEKTGGKFSGQSAGGGQSGGGDDLLFLCHPVAEKRDADPDSLFQQLSQSRDSGPAAAVVVGGHTGVDAGHGQGKGKDPQQGSAPDFPQAVQAQRFREAVQEKSGPQRQEKGTGTVR